MSGITVVRLDGGLGNQLFQVAFGEWLKRRFDREIIFDASGVNSAGHAFIGREFCDGSRVAASAPELGWRSIYRIGGSYNALALHIARVMGVNRLKLLLVEGDDDSVDGIAVTRAPVWAVGCWQGTRFADDAVLRIMDERLQAAAASRGLASAAANGDEETGIAVHLRWGDYKSDERNHRRHGLLGARYFHAALATLGADRPVTVFSESPAAAEWLVANSGRAKVRYAGTQGAWEDFFALSRYRRIAIANSTFSWWAAAFGSSRGKSVAMPASWYALDERWGRNASARLRREGWVQVENDWL